MKTFIVILFAICICCSSSVFGQGKKKQELTAGPKDDKELVAPGKIDSNASDMFKTTKSGLKYRILRKGKMDGKKATAADKVKVHYKGWLDNKKIFDSSYRRDETISFRLRDVIPGWTEGMQLVREGGMIELEIPAKLGYKDRVFPNNVIPPNSTLHFVVELFEIE